jgi:hypothetical protein
MAGTAAQWPGELGAALDQRLVDRLVARLRNEFGIMLRERVDLGLRSCTKGIITSIRRTPSRIRNS